MKEPLAFIKKDFLITYSYKVQFFMSRFGIFIVLSIWFFVAKLIGKNAAPYLANYGGDYFPFLLVGIAFSGYFGTALESFASNLSREQTAGTLEAMLVSPTKISSIILSMGLWNFINASIDMAIYLLFGIFVLGAYFNNPNILASIVILFFTIISFLSIGIISASFIMVFKRGDPISGIMNSFVIFFGGVYFPITILPKGLQTISYLLPITYSLRALRHALLQGYSFKLLANDIIVLLIFSAILLPLSIICFKYSVKIAKKGGTLTHY